MLSASWVAKLTTAVTLHLVDPTKRKWRFYHLYVQPDLFGQWCLIREWGRIGSHGQTITIPFASEDRAEVALNQQRRRKERRGYVSI